MFKKGFALSEYQWPYCFDRSFAKRIANTASKKVKSANPSGINRLGPGILIHRLCQPRLPKRFKVPFPNYQGARDQ